jgi:hypothetical protein
MQKILDFTCSVVIYEAYNFNRLKTKMNFYV